jgi:hypothetical protein
MLELSQYSEGFGLDDQGSIYVRSKGFSLLQSVETGSRAHPVFSTMGIGGGFLPGGKVTTHLYPVPRKKWRIYTSPILYVFKVSFIHSYSLLLPLERRASEKRFLLLQFLNLVDSR